MKRPMGSQVFENSVVGLPKPQSTSLNNGKFLISQNSFSIAEALLGLFKRSQHRPTLLDQQCWTMLALSVQTASTKIQNANNYVTMSINKMAPVFKYKVHK